VAVARPTVLGAIFGQVGSDGIELDIAVAGERIVVGMDQCGLEASFPQSPGAPLASVEAADVAVAHRLHHA
jgi:hypothetical protein